MIDAQAVLFGVYSTSQNPENNLLSLNVLINLTQTVECNYHNLVLMIKFHCVTQKYL